MANCSDIMGIITLFMVELLIFTIIGICSYYSIRSEGGAKLSYAISGCVFTIILIIFNCLLWCFWDQFMLASYIINIACEFLANTKRLMVISIFHLILGGLYLAFWSYSAILLYSLNEFSIFENND